MRTLLLLILYYGSVVYTLKNPAFGLLFFIHITIFRPEALVWGNTVFGRLHLITSLTTLSSYFIWREFYSERATQGYQQANVKIFLYFVLWLFVVSVFAEFSVSLSFDIAIEVAKVFILCFLFARIVTTRDRLTAYIWVVAISFGLLSFWGVLQGLAGNDRLDTLWPGGSNYIAAQLALVAPFIFANVFIPTLSRTSRLLFLTCTFWVILCCVYTDSRGGFFGLAAGMFIFILQVKQRVRVLVGFALMASLAYPFIPAHYTDRITSVFADRQEEVDESAASRPVLWKIALRIWSDYPITGVGLGNFSPIKEEYTDKVGDLVTSDQMFQLIFNRERFPHGLYPGMMAETGLIGMLLFLTLLGRNVTRRFPKLLSGSPTEEKTAYYLQAKGAQAGLLGFAVAAIFGDFQYLEMLYVQMFFVGAVYDEVYREAHLPLAAYSVQVAGPYRRSA